MNAQFPHSFSLSIADINVQINCNHAQLVWAMRERYRGFRSGTAMSPNFRAEVEWTGHDRQSSLLDTNVEFQGGILHFTAPGYLGFIDGKAGKGQIQISSAQPVQEIDYYLRVVYALLAHAARGILLHAAGIIRKGYAYLFFGPSGSGKTTLCRVSANDQIILNDDLILILPQGDSWRAYGTPFWNPTQVEPTSQSAPVKAMFLLAQAKQVAVREISSSKATAALLANIPVIPQDPVRSLTLLNLLGKIQETIPVQELFFLPDNSFWEVIPEE